MKHSTVAAVAALALVVPAGCGQKADNGPQEARVVTQRDALTSVMYAKLGHSRAIMEGLALSDFRTIEKNAVELERVSQSAAWMITDSVTYVLYSDQFRQIVKTMAQQARDEDLEAATAEFMRMTETCVACHTYLRRERLIRDFPETISQVDDRMGPLAARTGPAR